MADGSPSAGGGAEAPVMLREADGRQWVALPPGVQFADDEVIVRSDSRGNVTVEARRRRPISTAEERAAFWARIDAFKTGGSEDDWPEIERPRADEPDVEW